jgi:hypothetical protein
LEEVMRLISGRLEVVMKVVYNGEGVFDEGLEIEFHGVLPHKFSVEIDRYI